MNLYAQLQSGTPAIIAILRGVTPDEVLEVANTLIEEGIRIIEVPLNSPQPLVNIERLARSFGDKALVGAGTVTSVAAVNDVASVGGRLIVSPNANAAVIARAVERGLDVLPGVMTPTEAFAAIDAGARDLKLFPGGTTGPAHIRALREVLPADCAIWAVGGVSVANLAQWLEAGARGVGIGGSLYKPGVTIDSVRTVAADLAAAWNARRAHTR
ncbi:MAG: 2-dehydro-3-deoxy-6-phosphogalactonate aldolase [Steroidobacter sp.]